MSSFPQERGEILFSRYAYPPNELGYCGVGDGSELLELAAGTTNARIRTSAQSFDGAWPYLEIIALSNGVSDPLDEKVVEAYWIGNALLDAVDPAMFNLEVKEHFSSQRGADWECLDSTPAPSPHHSFHVFAIYPWMRLLRSSRPGPALDVIDRCRIGWGEVVEVTEDHLQVRSQRLVFDERLLVLGEPSIDSYRWRHDGRSLSGPLLPGDWVSTHWDWACQVLTDAQIEALDHYTSRQIEASNASIRQSV